MVPGPHLDAGNHHSLRLFPPRDLVNLRIPWPSLGLLPNTPFVISTIWRLFETFPIFLNIILFDVFLLFSYLKRTEVSQAIIIHISLTGNKLPLIVAGDTFKYFGLNFGLRSTDIQKFACTTISPALEIFSVFFTG